MKPRCPNLKCETRISLSPPSSLIIRNGFYFRHSDSKEIRRFICQKCRLSFSLSTLKPSYRQKKRRLNAPLLRLLNSGVSQRRAALILQVNPKTVVRRFRFLALQERLRHEAWFMETYQNQKLTEIQFDD